MAAIAGCQAPAKSSGEPAGRAFAVGSNLLGEPCRLAPGKADGATPPGETAHDLFCGRWEAPSGRVVHAAERRAPLDMAAASGWRTGLETFARCEAPVPTQVAGAPAARLRCTLRRGGWPYEAFVVEGGNGVFLAHMIPAAAPAAERAIAVLAGVAAPGDGDRDAMPVTDAGDTSRLYSLGELQAYRQLLRLAQQENFRGNFPQAEDRYREALALQQKVLPANAGGQAFVLMHLALELSNQERFTQADALFERSGGLVASSADPTDEPRWISYRAIHFANQQRYPRALELARQASALRVELLRQFRPGLGAEGDGAPPLAAAFGAGGRESAAGFALAGAVDAAAGDLVQSRFLEAAMLVKAGQLDEADRAARDALAILAAEPRVPRRWLSQLSLLQARIAIQRGELGRGEQLLQLATENERSLGGNGRALSDALLTLGDLYAQRRQYGEAFAAYASAFEVVRAAGASMRSEQVEAYFRAVLAAAEQAPDERPRLSADAFAVAQLVRGPLSAQTMALATARLAAGDSAGSQRIRELQDAKRRREALNEALIWAQTDPTMLPPQLAALEEEQGSINRRIADLERDVQAAHPSYNQLVDAPASLAETRSVLRRDEAMVQILIGRQSSVGLFITADSVELYPIAAGTARLRELVQRLRRPFDAAIGAPFEVALAAELFETLFGPVRQRLAAVEHVIIVPSGPLLSLPFAVLVTEGAVPSAEAGRSEAVPWMVRRHAITIAPSVPSFVNLRQRVRPSTASQPFLGFADFVPTRDVDAIKRGLGFPPACLPEVKAIASMQALPATAAEVTAVARAVGAPPSSVLLGPAFAEEAIRGKRLADYRVLYFATHGLLPQHLDCWAEPSLVVSRPPVAAAGDDGLLVASEIAALELDADLVVLSACNTGGPGGASGGESLSGLTRAFLYAGARSLLITHWQIPDAPTAELMVRTFELATRQNLPMAEALRQSQLALLQQPGRAHPLNWGAFSLVGDGWWRLRPALGRLAATAPE